MVEEDSFVEMTLQQLYILLTLFGSYASALAVDRLMLVAVSYRLLVEVDGPIESA